MTSQTAAVSGLSGRYAVALFELAEDAKALDGVEADLGRLRALLAESAEVSAFLSSPKATKDERLAAIKALGSALDLSDLVQKFLGVLATNRRLGALAATIRDYGRLLARHRGEVSADVVSAKPLTDSQLAELTKKLKLAVGRDVAIDAHVDESLLGGLVVKVGSRMVDSSLKTKLDNLQVTMKGVQ